MRQLAVFGAASLLMVGLTALQRDAQALRGAEEDALLLARALELSMLRRGAPPERLDPSLGVGQAVLRRFAPNLEFATDVRLTGRAAVYVARRKLKMLLREDGRFVVEFDGQHFSQRWYPESELEAAANQLGISELFDAGGPSPRSGP